MADNVTMSLPTEKQLRDLPKLAQAAFALRCLKNAPTITNWVGVRHVDVKAIEGVIDAVTRFTKGESELVQTNSLMYSIQSIAKFAEKEKQTNPPEGTNRYAANTSQFIYDFAINYVTMIAELARLDPYQTMEASLSAIRSYAIYSCDGDPSGAVAYAIEESRQDAVRQITLDFELLLDIANRQSWDDKTPVSPSLFDTATQVAQASPAQNQTPLAAEDKETRSSYKVFISFKNLDANGNPTPDFELAREVYEYLTKRGVSAFFSPVSLEELGTSAFKRAIEDALDQCQVLVAVGSSREHLESKWVRYEWDSFAQDMLNGIKPSAQIFSYVKGIPPFTLPRDLRQNQVFEHERDSLDQLYRFIDRALHSGRG